MTNQQTPLLILFISLLLCACQPPNSSESAGAQSLMLYWQLQQESLPSQIEIPVEGVTQAQIVDTWDAARSAGWFGWLVQIVVDIIMRILKAMQIPFKRETGSKQVKS